MSEANSGGRPTFFDTKDACTRLALSATFLKECRQAKLIEYCPIGDDRVRYTEEQMTNFENLVKAGGLKGVNKLFIELGIRKPMRKPVRKRRAKK